MTEERGAKAAPRPPGGSWYFGGAFRDMPSLTATTGGAG